MKKFLVQFLLLLSLNYGFGQQFSIPFRDGNKWGLCDENAKIIIEPKFDQIEFYENYSSKYDVLISKVNNLKGLIIEGKEILPPIYETIYEKGGKYIIIKTENGQKKSDVILPNGTSIFTKPISEIIRNENFADRFQLYHVLNIDKTESVFIFDPTANKISQWLYENYYSLDLIKMKSINTINFKVKKTENDGLILESWDFSNLPSQIKKTIKFGKSEDDVAELFMKKTNGRSGKYGSDSYGNGVSVVEEVKGDSDYDLVAVSYDAKEAGTPAKKQIYISKSFKVENEKLYQVTQNQYGGNGTKKVIPINLKIPLKDIEIKGYSLQEKTNDTTYYYNNTVVYKKNGKTGFLYSDNTKNMIEFDSITKNVVTLNNENGSDLVFVVANKDKKNNQYKYGFYSFKKKLLTPVKYDKLTATTLSYSDNLKSFIAQENDKFGIVSNNGKEILKTDNDEIKQLQTSRSSNKVLQIKKGNKYGFMYQKYGTAIETTPINFDFPAKEIIFDYTSYSVRKKSDENIKRASMNLIELFDESGSFVGYANTNGTLYYKN